MGAVQAWLEALIGIVVLAFAFSIGAMIIAIPLAYGTAMGGDAASLTEMIRTVFFKVSPVGIILSLVLYAFIESTRNEDDSRWRR